MRLLALLLLLTFAAPPAQAHVLVLVNDMTITDANSGRNMGPLWALLSRSLARGQRYHIVNNAALSLAELTDSVSVGASNPLYNAGLIVVVNPDRVATGVNLPAIQITKNVNRPKVPVMYINTANNDGFQNAVNESLGVTLLYTGAPTTDNLLVSPAGYVFPFAGTGYLWKRGAGGAYPAMGDYVTPVLTLAGYNYTKSDPNGVGGMASNPSCDTLAAWFYNPPILASRSGIASTAGYGCIGFDLADNNAGASNFPNAPMAAVAVGMMARLAPAQFSFPAVNVALDIDDGMKRFSGVASAAQVEDYLSGIDSLNAAGIKYTVGVEVDSMDTIDSNGSTRWANESARYFAKDLGKVTVHVHKGCATNGASTAADTSLASASGHVASDIFGVLAARRAFGSRAISTGSTAYNLSIYAQLNDAQERLLSKAGGYRRVTRHVMAATDNYKSQAASTSGGGAATYDSIFCAIAAAGFTVVRTQHEANQYNYQAGGGTGGIPYGRVYPLPMMRAVANQNGLTLPHLPRSILLAASGYIIGGSSNDTTTAQTLGSWRYLVNVRLGTAFGFVGHFSAATTDVTGSRGSVKETIWVTHAPNWRQASGAANAAVYGGGRVAWENVRAVHGAMMAAKWAAVGSARGEGPIRWVWADEITERDIR